MEHFSRLIVTLLGVMIGGYIFFATKHMLKALNNKIEDLSNQLKLQELLMQEMKSTIDNQKKILKQSSKNHEQKSQSVDHKFKQLELSIAVQQENQTVIEDRLQQLVEQQPEDKLYSRAFKLASLGADIEEIIRECDLPRAEAEMLLSVYKQKIR
jgi:hypothetical protein